MWLHGPYSTGMSRDGATVRTRNRMPAINRRRGRTGGRPSPAPFGYKLPPAPGRDCYSSRSNTAVTPSQ